MNILYLLLFLLACSMLILYFTSDTYFTSDNPITYILYPYKNTDVTVPPTTFTPSSTFAPTTFKTTYATTIPPTTFTPSSTFAPTTFKTTYTTTIPPTTYATTIPPTTTYAPSSTFAPSSTLTSSTFVPRL